MVNFHADGSDLQLLQNIDLRAPPVALAQSLEQQRRYGKLDASVKPRSSRRYT